MIPPFSCFQAAGRTRIMSCENLILLGTMVCFPKEIRPARMIRDSGDAEKQRCGQGVQDCFHCASPGWQS